MTTHIHIYTHRYIYIYIYTASSFQHWPPFGSTFLWSRSLVPSSPLQEKFTSSAFGEALERCQTKQRQNTSAGPRAHFLNSRTVESLFDGKERLTLIRRSLWRRHLKFGAQWLSGKSPVDKHQASYMSGPTVIWTAGMNPPCVGHILSLKKYLCIVNNIFPTIQSLLAKILHLSYFIIGNTWQPICVVSWVSLWLLNTCGSWSISQLERPGWPQYMISIRSCQHQAPAGLLVRLDLGLIRVIRLADMRSLHSGFRVIEHPYRRNV